MIVRDMKTLSWQAVVLVLSIWIASVSLAGDSYVEGIVYPIDDVALSMPVDGSLMTVNVKEGETVKKGQPLLGLDDRLQRLEVNRRKMIWQDKSQIETMKKNIDLLEELLKTKRDLYERTKTVSLSDLKRGQMQLNGLLGEYNGLLASKVKEKLEYEIAEETLSSYYLKSPIDGVIVEIVFAVGEWIRTGEKVIRVVNPSVCYLDINVDVSTAQRLRRQKDPIRIKIPADTEEIIKEGRINFVSAIADTGSSLVRMKFFFDNKDGRVVPGVPATIQQ